MENHGCRLPFPVEHTLARCPRRDEPFRVPTLCTRTAPYKSYAELKALAAALAATNLNTNTKSSLTLAMFPHIELAVVRHADVPTLKTLARTSRRLWALATPILRARHLRIDLQPAGVCICELPPLAEHGVRVMDPEEPYTPEELENEALWAAAGVVAPMFPPLALSPPEHPWETLEEANAWVMEHGMIPDQEDFLGGYPRYVDVRTHYTTLTAPPGGIKYIPHAETALDTTYMTHVLDVAYHPTFNPRDHPPSWSWNWFPMMAAGLYESNWVNVKLIRDIPGTFPTTDAEYAALSSEWKSPFTSLEVVSHVQIVGTRFTNGREAPRPLNAFHNVVVSLWINFSDDRESISPFYRYEPADIPTKHVTVLVRPWDGTCSYHWDPEYGRMGPYKCYDPHDVALQVYLCWLSKAASVTVVGLERVKRTSPGAHADAKNILRRAVACSAAGTQNWWIQHEQNLPLVSGFTGELSSHNPDNANMKLAPSRRPTRRCNLVFETLESYRARVGEYYFNLLDLYRNSST